MTKSNCVRYEFLYGIESPLCSTWTSISFSLPAAIYSVSVFLGLDFFYLNKLFFRAVLGS